MTSPCKDCQDRHTACHGHCEKYKDWKDLDQAQKKHLKETSNRWAILGSEARDKIRYSYHRGPTNG